MSHPESLSRAQKAELSGGEEKRKSFQSWMAQVGISLPLHTKAELSNQVPSTARRVLNLGSPSSAHSSALVTPHLPSHGHLSLQGVGLNSRLVGDYREPWPTASLPLSKGQRGLKILKF